MNCIGYEWLDAERAEACLHSLCRVLDGCVAQGASVGFTERDPDRLLRFWQHVVPALACGDKRLLVAKLNGYIVATVMVGLAMPPNGAHRAEIVKLLVHPDARRRGIARELMIRAEACASEAGRSLLVLDTRSGDVAEALYLSLGWEIAGKIPDYAISTEGNLDATTLMFKRLPTPLASG